MLRCLVARIHLSNRFLCPREQRSLLIKCAATALSSKLIARQKDFFSKMVVDAVSLLDEMLPLNMIGVKKVQGGSLEVRKGWEGRWRREEEGVEGGGGRGGRGGGEGGRCGGWRRER